MFNGHWHLPAMNILLENLILNKERKKTEVNLII
jgi:hypothetical protein